VTFFFTFFLQSPHEVDMKNIAECQKEFFASFNAFETRGDTYTLKSGILTRHAARWEAGGAAAPPPPILAVQLTR
jgi:hypothetical protein